MCVLPLRKIIWHFSGQFDQHLSLYNCGAVKPKLQPVSYIVGSEWRNVRDAYQLGGDTLYMSLTLIKVMLFKTKLQPVSYIVGSEWRNVRDAYQLGGDTLYMSLTLIKVMLFIPWHPISLYWGRTLSHTDSQFLYTGIEILVLVRVLRYDFQNFLTILA